ncbi:hypothetical protein HMPREF9124_1527 [Oribacterium sp. oral taxon 108 str. F0425]|nr:hypothetical protein [Oribacterium sp. oral taxon 108]EGL37044.1 hypothetical protein HMPREF9124_1527 [Oribacterium sp. oral taxon 108 str. F0425]
MKQNKLLLIDGHSILSRAFYGVPILSNHEGIPTNGVFGFLNIFFKELELEETEHVAVFLGTVFFFILFYSRLFALDFSIKQNF